MEVGSRQQNLGFGSVHAKFDVPDVYFDTVRKEISKLGGIKLDSFENGRRRAVKLDSTPAIEEQMRNILEDLNGIGVRIIKTVKGGISGFESDKRWVNKNHD